MAAPSRAGRASYRDHVVAMRPFAAAASDVAASGGPDAPVPTGLPPELAVICVYGSSEYLMNHAVALLRDKAERGDGAAVTALEATSLTEQHLACMGEQGSLFEPSALYIIRRCEQAKSLPKLLKTLAAGSSRNRVCLVYKGDSPVAALKTELARLGAHMVPCVDPWPNETAPVIQAMALEKGLKLKPDAVQLLTETTGCDLVKLDHELAKLALLCDAATPLGAAAIAPHLGMLRADDAFQLDRLLLGRHWARAQALADDLLHRGEKPTALLGILANHCRNALRIAEALRRGARPHELGAGLRMPPFLIKTYAQQLQGVDPRRYARALVQCRAVDALLKSMPLADTLQIASVLAVLGTD